MQIKERDTEKQNQLMSAYFNFFQSLLTLDDKMQTIKKSLLRVEHKELYKLT